jgi:pimeloyl-ACP methyl ester carboxylesterase
MLHIGGLTALVRRRGAGAPIMLLHGLGCSGRYFRELERRLATTHLVITPDLPGHGASDKPPDRMWHLVELTNWVALLIEHLALGPMLIAGHSLGGGVAVDLAWRHPSAASALVLLAPTGLPDMPPLLGQVAQLGLDAIREPLRLYPQIVPAYLRAGPRRIVRLAIDQTHYGQRQALSRLRRPILVVRGSRDPVVTWELVDDILHEAHAASYVEVPGAAHALQVSHPVVVAGHIRRFALESAAEAAPVR